MRSDDQSQVSSHNNLLDTGCLNKIPHVTRLFQLLVAFLHIFARVIRLPHLFHSDIVYLHIRKHRISSYTGILICFFQVLFEQFKFFLNLYFLVMACSQFIPAIRIGYLYTYWAPLVSTSFSILYISFIDLELKHYR